MAAVRKAAMEAATTQKVCSSSLVYGVQLYMFGHAGALGHLIAAEAQDMDEVVTLDHPNHLQTNKSD